MRKYSGLLILGGVVLLIVVLMATNGSTTSTASEDSKTSSKGAVTRTLLLGASGCDKNKVVTLALENQNFTDDQFVIGEDKIDWSQSVATQHGNGSFTTAKKTSSAWVKWLSSSDPSAKLVVKTVSAQANAPKKDLLKPKGWVAFQVKVPSAWDGNTLVSNGTVKAAGTRHSAAGDAGWIYVNLNDCSNAFAAAKSQVQPGHPAVITADAVMSQIHLGVARLGCGNPQSVLPRPVTPPPTPTNKPGQPTTTPTTRKPALTFDCMQNGLGPNCPEGVKRVIQPVQHNPCCNTGPTPGAGPEPKPNPKGPTPHEGTPPPDPNGTGYNSGSPTGSGTPTGSKTNPDGSTTGGGPTPTTLTPTTVDTGTHNSDPGGF